MASSGEQDAGLKDVHEKMVKLCFGSVCKPNGQSGEHCCESAANNIGNIMGANEYLRVAACLWPCGPVHDQAPNFLRNRYYRSFFRRAECH